MTTAFDLSGPSKRHEGHRRDRFEMWELCDEILEYCRGTGIRCISRHDAIGPIAIDIEDEQAATLVAIKFGLSVREEYEPIYEAVMVCG